jgi:iron complex transport system permease protein
LKILLPLVILGFLGLYAFAKDLNVLLLGEEDATHLGVNVGRTQTVVFLLAPPAGMAVAFGASDIWAARRTWRDGGGSDHRALFPAAALGVLIVLVLSDTLARTLVAPNEFRRRGHGCGRRPVSLLAAKDGG